MPSIQRKKEEENEQQRISWNNMSQYNLSKEKFYNNINYNLREYYYSNKNPNVIDFDILDYIKFEEENGKEGFIILVDNEIAVENLRKFAAFRQCEFAFSKLGEKEKYTRGNKEAPNSLIRGNSFK